MATATIQKLRVDSTLGTSLSRSSAFPSIVRKLLKLWLFPRVLREIDIALSGDRLGYLTSEQAQQLYGPLSQFYSELNDVLANPSWLSRFVFGWWINRARRETEKLGEIVETLAWGSDGELREFIDSSIEAVESRV